MGADAVAVVRLVETEAGVDGAMVDAAVRTGEGEAAGELEGLPCWAEASAEEKITKALGRKLERDRRNMVIRS